MAKSIRNKRPPKVKLGDNNTTRFIKVLSTESEEKFKEMGELINNRKIKWMYYKIENSIGVHYYLKLKS
jgi:hypothetical protein